MKLIRIAVLGVALAVFASGCADEGNVFSLKVGDCFTSIAAAEIADLPLVDCSEPHEHEVIALWDVGDTLPSQEAMAEGCVDRFEEAIGLPYDQSAIVVLPITPTTESYDQGDREVICYSAEFDDADEPKQITGSVLGSKR